MKPFDIEAALEGAKVVTRDGCKAKILWACADMCNGYLLVRVKKMGAIGFVQTTLGGKCIHDVTGSTHDHPLDLFMADEKVKKPKKEKGYIVVEDTAFLQTKAEAEEYLKGLYKGGGDFFKNLRVVKVTWREE